MEQDIIIKLDLETRIFLAIVDCEIDKLLELGDKYPKLKGVIDVLLETS